MTKAQITLLPHESKRLIAKGVKKILEDSKILNNSKIVVNIGTTNLYVAEELTGESFEEGSKFVAGLTIEGVQCINAKDNRIKPVLVDEKGNTEDIENVEELVHQLDKGDVFIKGANALDSDYNIGIYLANELGGTMSTYPVLEAKGINIMVPVGREKLIPSVPQAARKLGTREITYNLGKASGMLCVCTAQVITEIEAFSALFEVDAFQVAAGGVDGSSGACGFLLEGEEKNIKEAVSLVKELKKDKPYEFNKMPCSKCDSQCYMNKDL